MKNFILNLFGKMFNRNNSDSNSKVSYDVTTGEEDKNSEQNTLLQKIYWAMGNQKLDDMEKYIHEYLSKYGELTGKEMVWFWGRKGDIYDGYYCWDSINILFLATDFIRKIFFSLVNGKEEEAAEYLRQAKLQENLLKAFRNQDVIAFDKLLAEGADINFVYEYDIDFVDRSYRKCSKFTLWEKLQKQGAMYEYFMTRMDCNEVRDKVAKEKAEKELIEARRALVA